MERARPSLQPAPAGRATSPALVRRARRSPTSSKFNRYLNPKGNEQTSGIGCQGIFSFVGRIYPQVFPQQVISGPRRRFRSADAVASGRAPGRSHRGPGIHGRDRGATPPKQATGLGCPILSRSLSSCLLPAPATPVNLCPESVTSRCGSLQEPRILLSSHF